MQINFDKPRYADLAEGDLNAVVAGIGADDNAAFYQTLVSIADDLSLDDPILELEDLM